MITALKKYLKWNLNKTAESKKTPNYYIIRILLGYLEKILLWRNFWMSFSLTTLITILFLVKNWTQSSIIMFIIYFVFVIIVLDAFETWLMYKHRTTSLKKLAAEVKYPYIENTIKKASVYIVRRKNEWKLLRDSNHPKAFLLVNIILGFLYLIGLYINGPVIVYLIVMSVLLAQPLAPKIHRIFNKIQYNLDSDAEIESLLPDESDVDMGDLNIEPTLTKTDGSIENWKPRITPDGDDNSDSSDNSSYVTNLSKEKFQAIEGEDTSDSSEDEYMPLVKDHYRTTLEVNQAADSWGGTAYNALRSFGGAMYNMVYTKEENNKLLVPRRDSSDGFEMVDNSEL